MPDVVETVLRTVGGFALILLLERLLGKRTIAKMNYRDFVGATMAGTVAANMAFNLKIATWVFILSLVLLGLVLSGITRLEFKSAKVRKILEGMPVIIVENGEILRDRMEKQKMNEGLLLQQLRCKDIFELKQVEKALIEPNGKIRRGFTLSEIKYAVKGSDGEFYFFPERDFTSRYSSMP